MKWTRFIPPIVQDVKALVYFSNPMKIAVLGSGISGLASAWLLSQKHEVTLFEKEDYCGGHSHTIDVSLRGKTFPIDTGFMVFNLKGYPQLAKFMRHLGIKTQKSDMSFSVSLDDGAFEYSSTFPSGTFADFSNCARPSFYQFLAEIPRFDACGRKALADGVSATETIDAFLDRNKLSKEFRRQYLYPMGSLIWSTPPEVVATFPIKMLLTFLQGHNLLSIRPGLEWRSIVQGSRQYVQRMLADIEKRGGKVRLSTPIISVMRTPAGAQVATVAGTEDFDAVVMATHADTTLTLLKDVDEKERGLLSPFKYQFNRVIAHSDRSFMPKRKAAWAAWNFCDVEPGSGEKAALTYSMNILQRIPESFPIYVTINPVKEPNAETVHGDFLYAHPVHSLDTHAAQEHLGELQGRNNTYFAGSYFGYGFHEDAFVSALSVAACFGIQPPWEPGVAE